jgi:hypothetical protein
MVRDGWFSSSNFDYCMFGDALGQGPFKVGWIFVIRFEILRIFGFGPLLFRFLSGHFETGLD